MNNKILLTTITFALLVTGSAAQLEFRTESPIDSYSNFDMNGNLITNLSNPQDPQDAVNQRFAFTNFVDQDGDTLLGDLYLNGNDIYGVGRLELENGTNITGSLEVNGTTTTQGNINLRGNKINLQNGYITNDGGNGGIKIEDNGNVKIPSGGLDVDSVAYVGNDLRLDDTDGQQYITVANDSDNLNFAEAGGTSFNKASINARTVEIPNGNLEMNSNAIKNLAAPIDSNDAVRLQYVEGNFVNRSGDTLTGSIDMNGNSINDIGSVDGGGDAIRSDNSLDLNGNSLTSSGGELCVGRYC